MRAYSSRSAPAPTASSWSNARQHPNKFNVGAPFQMGARRVAWEAFAEAARIKVNWIAYKGGGPVLLAVAGRHVDAGATNPGNVKPFVISGKVRVLGVSSERNWSP